MENRQVNKKALGILSAGHFVSDAYGGFIYPIMPLIADKLNIPLGIVGLLLGISSLSSSLTQPFFGYISDLIERRFFIVSGLILSSIFMSLIGWTNDIWTLGLVIFLGSMGVGLFHPQGTAFAGHLSGKDINKYMGIFTACGTVGFAFGPFFSSLLVENLGLHSTIYAFIPGFIITLILYKFLPKIPAKINHTKLNFNFKALPKLNKIILILGLIAVIRSIVITSFDVFMPFIWQKNNISVLAIGTIIALFSLSGGITSYIGGRLSNRYDKRKLLALSMIPSIPFLLGTVLLLNTAPVLSFLMFIISGAIITSSSSINIVIAQKAAPENIGLVSGIIGGFCWGIAGILQSPIGFLATKFGIAPVLITIALLPIIGSITACYMNREYA